MITAHTITFAPVKGFRLEHRLLNFLPKFPPLFTLGHEQTLLLIAPTPSISVPLDLKAHETRPVSISGPVTFHMITYILLAFFNQVKRQASGKTLQGWGPLKGAKSGQKASQGFKTEMREFACLKKQKRAISPQMKGVIDLPCNDFFLQKQTKQRKIILTLARPSRPGARSPHKLFNQVRFRD